jgi:hypothetical protein
MRTQASLLCIRMDSVISSSRRFGARPEAESADTTVCTKFAVRNWAAETLTASRRPSGQLAASRQASRSAHSPSGTMRRVSSATGMNSPGCTWPRCGWFQRKSASNPTTSFVPCASHIGW